MWDLRAILKNVNSNPRMNAFKTKLFVFYFKSKSLGNMTYENMFGVFMKILGTWRIHVPSVSLRFAARIRYRSIVNSINVWVLYVSKYRAGELNDLKHSQAPAIAALLTQETSNWRRRVTLPSDNECRCKALEKSNITCRYATIHMIPIYSNWPICSWWVKLMPKYKLKWRQ